jgi:ABC-type Zn2+ transport system substrate-binding protein/surface adhesin
MCLVMHCYLTNNQRNLSMLTKKLALVALSVVISMFTAQSVFAADTHKTEHEHHHGNDGHANEHEHHHGDDGHADEHEHHHGKDSNAVKHEHHNE